MRKFAEIFIGIVFLVTAVAAVAWWAFSVCSGDRNLETRFWIAIGMGILPIMAIIPGQVGLALLDKHFNKKRKK
jgi:uncharacterized membrane protein YphA (DoxX/SURF4 family)